TLLTAILVAFGLATVYSASAITAMQVHHNSGYFVLRQVTGVIFGLLVFAVVAKVDAERWYEWAWPVMIISLVLLLFVVLPFTTRFAPRIHGARRYLFGASVQPSEMAKLAVIVWTSMLVIKKGPALRRLSKGLLPFVLVVGALDILVYLEPDLSSAMFYTLMMGIILFAGGVRVGHFVVMVIVGIPILYTRAQKLQYVMLRMSAFFDPGLAPSHVDYQSRQSLIAVGSGGLFGVGFGNGRQQYGFLPFAYDDFIGGNIGEEWGFVGLTVLILAFALYAWLGFQIARNARTPFQRLVAVGITSAVIISAYLHLGVVISLLPNTGLTLPFISYGRSNLVMSLLLTGILVNIGSEREKVIGDGATNPLELAPA
ncbi:MAG TPA: putative peptidoglycan glycosyltransferase FtsW, partial [Gemmatimonadaceae bacterium]|nr:putative peptidoglycan glycosyltransferase FtsW [Gemmatimonadaceae bacterium]